MKLERKNNNEVRNRKKGRFQTICGQKCVKIKEDEYGTYFMTVNKLFNSVFGKTNNYATSYIREKLKDCDFANALRKEFGDRLVSVPLSLTSLDGLDDYGSVEDDTLSLLNLDLYRECRKNIPDLYEWEWLATPNSTPSGDGTFLVQFVFAKGSVCHGEHDLGDGAVRPFFVLKTEHSEAEGVSNLDIF